MNAADYVRVCPVCGAEHAPAVSQCGACGALLIGVDLSLRDATPPAAVPATPAPPGAAPAALSVPCPHADCGALNPAGSADCVYCGRPLAAAAEPAKSLYNLPSVLAANFVIERVLPAGGAEAELMLLKGIKTGARVMAKLYRPGIAPKGEVLERVGRVADAHVVHLLTHGVSDGIAYEVMEYCSGGSLRDMMTGGVLPPARVRTILAEVAEALAALHECRVVHRDLKPENVLVRRPEPLDLVLTDFGIASLQDGTQFFTGLARTARYAAPEAMTGILDEAADYWSLGMMMVEMLQGEHPFAGLSDTVIAHRLATGGVDTAGVRDGDWRRLCRGLLQRDPARRWRIGEIRRWLAGDKTLPEPEDSARALPDAYRIEGEECRTLTEVAVAFARRWASARKDLARGEFENWARSKLEDHDLVRKIHDIKERGGSPDLQLFRLVRHLAPASPPSWQGRGLDVDSVLAAAARVAATGDEQAADWLAAVHTERVLEELPADEYPLQRQLRAEWLAAKEAFDDLWRRAGEALGDWRRQRLARGDVVVDIDSLIYGGDEGLRYPPAGMLHAGLMLSVRSPSYIDTLRPTVLAQAALHLVHSPWLTALAAEAGRADAAGALALLAVQHLLPRAREASEEGHRRVVAEGNRRDDRLRELLAGLDAALATIREAVAGISLFDDDRRQALGAGLEHFLSLSLEARGFLGSDAAAEPALRSVAGAEPVVLALRDRLEQWQSSSRITDLWRNEHLVQAAGGVLVGLLVFAPQLLPFVLVPPVVFAVWRFWIGSHHRSAIRQLAERLPRMARRGIVTGR